MALRASELLLIVRAQNQASGALRRVAGDMAGLSKIRDLHFRQNQLAINQATTMRQRQRALNELQAIETQQGFRNLSLQRRRLTNQAQELAALNNLEKAQSRYMRSVSRGATGRPLIQMRRDVERYQKALQATRVGTRQLGAAEMELANRASILRSEIDSSNARLAQNAFQQREIAKAIQQQKWERLQAGGRIATHLGRVMQLAGLVVGAALAFMASSAAKFNTEATLVATQTGKIGSGAPTVVRNSKLISAALLGVMAQSTATREELTQAAYDIYSSLNVSLQGGMRLLRMFSRASIAGMTPLPDVTHAAITVMNDFGLRSLPQVHGALNRMFAAVRFGRMNFQQFVGMISTTAPAFKAAGQSFDSMAGAMAFLTRMMPNTRMAGTALARLTEIIGRKDFVQGAKEFGVSITDIHGRLLPMITVMDKLVARFPKLREGGTFLQNFIKMITAGKDEKGGLQGTIQARRALTFMVQHLKLYHQIQRQVTTDQNEFARSFSAMRKTAGVQWGVFVNRLKALAIVIGAAVIPALLKLSQPLQRLINWFTKLDGSTKAQISRWATYAAGLLLFGGTVISVGGMLVSFLAIMGRFGIAGTGIAAIFVAIVAAIKILTGEWRSLNDVVTSFADTMTGSFKGAIAMSALLVVAALRIRRAFAGLAAMQVAGGAAVGGRGLFAGIGEAIGLGATAGGVARLEGAGRLRAGLRGAAMAAAALPGPLKVAAAAIGLGAVAAGLWELHMRGARKRAEEVADAMNVIHGLERAPQLAARRLGGVGLDVREVERQKISLRGINREIGETRKQLSQAAVTERPQLLDQLKSLTLDQADAYDSLRQAQAKFAFDARGLNVALIRQGQIIGATAALKARRQELEAQLKTLREQAKVPRGRGGAPDLVTLAKTATALKNVNRLIAELGPVSERNARSIRFNFSKAVRGLQQISILPAKIRPGALEAAFRVATQRGRFSIKDIRATIKAYVDPASLRKAPRDIQAAVRAVKAEIEFRPIIKRSRQVFAGILNIFKPLTITQNIKTKAVGVGLTRKAIEHAFSTVIQQRIHISPGPEAAHAAGVAIVQGVKAGLGSEKLNLDVIITKHINSIITKTIKAGSPSKVTRDLIGIPMMQGIITGIEMMYGQLEQSSRLAIEFFNGPWLSSETFTNRTAGTKKQIAELTNRIHALRKAAKGTTPQILALQERLQQLKHPGTATTRDLIRDLMATLQAFRMFNNAMERLQRRGVPLLLLDQLSQLGAEGARKIQMLARMTNKQLRRYVALWKAAMAEVQRSNRTVMDQITSDIEQKTADAASFLLDMYNTMKENLNSIFGDIGQTLTDQMTNTKDALLQVFGELFQGAYFQSQEFQTLMDWGHILNTADLFKDLQSQIDALNSWSNDISAISAAAPADFVAYLMGLGPDAAKYIHAIAGMSGPQLKAYVTMWETAQKRIKDASIKDFGAFGKGADPMGAIQAQVAKMKHFGAVMDNLAKKGVPFPILAQILTMGPGAIDFADALNTMSATDLSQFVDYFGTMQSIMDTLTKKFMQGQIDEWRKHGNSIAVAIITGIMDQQSSLLKFFRELFKNLLREAKKETKSKSPSLVFRDLGMDIMAGLQLGLDSGAMVPSPRLGGSFLNGRGYGVGQSAPIHMEVHAHQDESLMTTLERAAFRLRNRRP